MGKRIIIKGADFSADGMYEPIVEWYNDGSKYSPRTLIGSASIAGMGIIGNNKPVNIVRIYLNPSISQSSPVKIYLGTAGNQYTGNEPALANYSITSDDVENGYADILLLSTVTPTSQQALMVSCNIIAYYYQDSSTPPEEDKNYYLRSYGSEDVHIVSTADNTVYVCMQYGYVINQ